MSNHSFICLLAKGPGVARGKKVGKKIVENFRIYFSL